jgi:hypothetical protein
MEDKCIFTMYLWWYCQTTVGPSMVTVKTSPRTDSLAIWVLTSNEGIQTIMKICLARPLTYFKA